MAWASPVSPLSVLWAACGGCVWRVRVEGAWPGRAPCHPCPFRGPERRLTPRLTRGAREGAGGAD